MFYTEIGLQYLEVIDMPIMPSAVINDVNLARWNCMSPSGRNRRTERTQLEEQVITN